MPFHSFDDGEPEDANYIFGDTSMSLTDNTPRVEKHHKQLPFRRIAKGSMKKHMQAVNKRTNRKNPLPFATPVVLDAKDGPSSEPEYTYTEIPDKIRERDTLPELDAEQRLPVENLVQYTQQEINDVHERAETVSDEATRLLLEQGAALLMSYDESSSYVEAMLRDGLGITVEIDSSISEAISHMMRLNLVTFYADKMALPEDVRRRYLRVLTEKFAEDTHAAINKNLTGERYSTILKNLQARMAGGSGAEAEELVSTLGMAKRRSSQGLPTSPNSNTSAQHDYNTAQEAGVRFSTV